MKSIALFGGTFNPIHYGHLAAAEEVRTRFNLDKVVFVPTFHPPHKDMEDVADARARATMVHLATTSNPCFDVSTFEIERGEKSYTIDTVRHFKSQLDEDTQLYFIIGADMLTGISGWKNIEQLLKLCKFIAVPRPGYDVQKTFDHSFIASNKLVNMPELLENILIENVPMLDISSSSIRKRVREWKSIKYLVPEPVEQFIHNQKLYL